MGLGRALSEAVLQVRARLDDPGATIAVVTPSAGNGVFARQQLALAGGFIRVEFWTPERLTLGLTETSDLVPEPAGWRSVVVGALLAEAGPDLAGGLFHEVLSRPGWKKNLLAAAERLEHAGVHAGMLRLLASSLPSQAARLEVLAATLAHLAARRAKEGFVGFQAQCVAARAAVDRLDHSPAQRVAGAVVLGDRTLAPCVFSVLQAWLAQRPHVVVRQAPLSNLAPASGGLRAAAEPLWIIEVPTSDSRLGRLQRSLYARALPAGGCGDDDGSVTLARCPDDVREVREAVRQVVVAIEAGVPLQAIALVVPDDKPVAELASLLGEAGIPATWLVGPTLDRSGPAVFLTLALALLGGADSARAWYALLRAPALRLRDTLGPDAVVGRGRWRRLLAECGAVAGTERIVSALTARVRDDREGDAAAVAGLKQAMAGLWLDLQRVPRRAPLSVHGEAFAELVERWCRRSSERHQIAALCRSWGQGGPEIGREAARAELADTLASAPASDEAGLNDSSVRVVSPMGMIGGAFQRVVGLGLSQGRLPRTPREDALLPDALLLALNDRFSTGLDVSREVLEMERRRVAAVFAAATERVWLSTPGFEMLSGRQLLPSSALLDLVSALNGRRATYTELAKALVRHGSRSAPVTAEPARAASDLEHAVASVRADPAAAVSALTQHPIARRLLSLHRAIDRSALGAFDEWTGVVSTDVLPYPGLDGSPLAPTALARLVRDPSGYFFKSVLGARRPPVIPRARDPLDSYSLRDRVADALVAAATAREDAEAAFHDAWTERWAHDTQFIEVAPHVADLAGALSASQRQRWPSDPAPIGLPVEVAGRPDDSLPWQVQGTYGLLDGDRLWVVDRSLPKAKSFAVDALAIILQGVCLQAGGTAIGVVEVYDRSSAVCRAVLADQVEAARAALANAARCAAKGWWPVTGTGPLYLSGEGLGGRDPVELLNQMDGAS